MLIATAVRLVEWCRRNAVVVAVLALGLTVLFGIYTAGRLGINTDTGQLLSPELPWRQQAAAFDRAFPQNTELLVIVVDGATPELADAAAARLAAQLAARPDLFRTVRRPDAGEFFKRNGLLFLSVPEVAAVAEQVIAAQPLLAALARDPSLRGLFDALNLALEGVARDETGLRDLDRPLSAIADTAEGLLAGTPRPFSWQGLFTGRAPRPEELRRFILTQPVLDYGALQAGARATGFVRATANELGLTPDNGVRVRLTGEVAIADEEFGTIAEGTGFAGVLSLLLVCLILFLAVRSVRLIAPILLTLAVGLVATGAFAAAAVGTLNPISVAFAIMFVGIAVDFSIQFSVRFRDQRYRIGDRGKAMRRTAETISGPLLLAAATTAAGFLSFVPTEYIGVSQLGLIAGVGMIIAVLLNLTLLPALLTLFRPKGERAPVGTPWAAGIDRFLLRWRHLVLLAALGLGAIGVVLTPHLRFDANPLNLRDPKTESVATALDLMSSPTTTTYTIDILAESPEAAAALAQRLEALPEVEQALTVYSLVPEQQDEKLAILADTALLLGPTLTPSDIAPPPDAAAVRAALSETVRRLRGLGVPPDSPAGRVAAALGALLQRDDATLDRFGQLLLAGLPAQLETLRLALDAQPVTLDSLPESLRRDWVTPDGRARIEVYPSGDARNNATLVRFADAVRAVAPQATGTVVTLVESGRTVVGAFIQAGIAAVVAIALMLFLVLRRVADVLLVLGPLVLAGLLTVITCVVFDIPINFANIIALPLLLGIGVAFNIYFVMNWRAGLAGPLQSSTARAVFFSALTTCSAFGSLALSTHPGTAAMGLLLTLALSFTLLTAFFVLPAMLGPVPGEEEEKS